MAVPESPAGKRRDSLTLRLLTAIVGLPIVFVALWVGGPVLLVLAGVAALVGLWEFRALTAHLGTLSITVAGASILAFIISAAEGSPLPTWAVVLVVVGGLIWHMARHAWQARDDSALTGWALTLAGAFYPGALLAFGIAIYGLEFSTVTSGLSGESPTLKAYENFGRDWLLFAVLLVFVSDTSAYGVGRLIGRHKMAPRLSPGKTWEGAVGAILITAVTGWTLILVLNTLSFSGPPLGAMVCGDLLVELPGCKISIMGIGVDRTLLTALGVGVGVSLLAQVGDLAESFLKRQGGAKEAGFLLPGHGGILDRLDSIVLVLPAVYYGLIWAI